MVIIFKHHYGSLGKKPAATEFGVGASPPKAASLALSGLGLGLSRSGQVIAPKSGREGAMTRRRGDTWNPARVMGDAVPTAPAAVIQRRRHRSVIGTVRSTARLGTGGPARQSTQAHARSCAPPGADAAPCLADDPPSLRNAPPPPPSQDGVRLLCHICLPRRTSRAGERC